MGRAKTTGDKIVTLTEVAAKKIREFIEKEGDASSGLRITARQNPDGGVIYRLQLDDSLDKKDIVLHENHIAFYIDPESASVIRGSRIDYIQTDKSSGFVIINPNVSCGCGPNCACQN